MPAQANATVIKLVGAPTADDWDRAGAAGTDKWVGAARAYYRERADRVRGADSVDVLTKRELILDVVDVDLMALDTDDVITFTVDGQAGELTGTARTVPRPRLAGVPTSVQTSRVILEDA